MIQDPATNNNAEEPEEINDEDATLADDLLDEVSGDVTEDEDDTVEGFGILPEVEDEEDEEKDDDSEDVHDLEEDAEDVDFDTFDDIDEL